MLVYKEVKTPEEIKKVSELAYLLFPIDYGPYVRAEHIQLFLDRYQTVEAIQEQIEGDYTYYLVYNAANELLGYVGLNHLEACMELSKLYILVEKRGGGIGKEIMEWIDTKTLEKGYANLELDVVVENEGAVRFYKRLGFAVKEMFERQFDTGYSERNYRLIKQL